MLAASGNLTLPLIRGIMYSDKGVHMLYAAGVVALQTAILL